MSDLNQANKSRGIAAGAASLTDHLDREHAIEDAERELAQDAKSPYREQTPAPTDFYHVANLRDKALNGALHIHTKAIAGSDVDNDKIVATAQAFMAFLSGESDKATKAIASQGGAL